MPRFLSVILKVLLALLLLVVLAVVGTLVALRIPSVQTDVAQRAARVLTDKLGQQVIVTRVDIRPFSRVVLEGVRVLDRRGNELFNIGRADADIRLFSIFDPSHLHVGKLTLEEPRFNLVTYKNQPDSTTLDQFISSVKRLLGPSDTTKVSKPFDFKIEALGLRNGRFVLDRQNVPRIPEYGRTMDYAHMYLDSIYADADQLWFKGDTIHANIRGLRTVDTPSGTRLRELTSDMTYAGKFWEFDKLMLRVQNSQLHDYIRFEYDHFLNFTDFNDSVKVIARLKPGRVYSDDIAKFAPQPFMRDLKETVLISGEAKGYVRNFTTKNLDITYGRNTRVKGDINVEGLPNFKESFIEMRLQPSVVDGRDIRRYIPASGWPYVQRLGTVKLKGQFLGFYNDFVANGSFQTALGSVVSDVNLKFKDDPRYSSYEGTVRTTGFQLGRLLGDESLVRDVTMNGKVAGVGFDVRTARLTANATIPSIWLNGYRFRNISTNGRFSRESFTGKLAANDPNLQFDADGTVELNKQRQAFDLRARIRRADLRALGLTRQSVIVATTADVKFKGLKLDELLGYARLRNSRLSYAGRNVPIDTLDIVSQYGGGQRRLTVRSEVLNLALEGNFTPTTVLRDVTTLIEEYRLNFASNDAAIADYYRRKRQRPLPDYQIGLNLYLKRPNPLLHLFVPQLTISDSTRVEGSFRNGQTSIFQLGGRVAEVRYDSLQLRNNEFDLTTSKLPYQPEVLAQASVTSERQRVPGLGATEKFYVEGVWDQERINFSTSLAQTGTTNKAQINGALAFLDDAVKITFRQSGVNVLGKDWAIAPDNSLVISGGGREFDFQNVTLSNGNQSISAQGFLSENPNKPLALTVKDFELATLSGLTGTQKFAGRVNALGTISGVYGPLVINSTLTVDSLQMGTVLIGNVQGRGDWDNALKRLAVNLDVARDQQRVLAVTGYIAPGAEKQQLSLTGVLDNAPIKLAEPFLNTIFRDMSGTGVGTLRLNGLLSAPQLTGNIDVSNGQLTFIYLGTTYTFSDRIRFLEDRIALQNITVRDPQGNSGVVNGNIYQQGFQNMRLDLNASFRKLQVLNTTRKDNELYFGQAYATGTAVVRGPADNLFINVTARSEAGTRVSLPFDNAAKAEQANYIRFVNRNLSDTARTAPVQVAGTTDLSGIRLNMNLDITPDAYVELLLDESTGDIIRGTATGQLRLNIDTRGDFNMYGQVEIVRGAYNFTLQGLVNKEFVVRPGGTISWNGDPLAGEMNVTATYTQRTSLAPIVYNTANASSSNAAVVPVTAVMNLSGPLLQPIIRLNLEFNDIPSSLEGDLAPFFSAIRNDEQELNRQVFSLIVFRQLTPIGSLAVTRLQGENNAIGNSLGQIISTQLGLLTSQIDPNLEISFNLNGLTAEDLQALQLRLSYAFLNGRLRITREGSISSNTTASSGGTTPIASSQTSFIGDLSLEYYLRPDGKFRAKLRYETTPRDLTSFTQGVNQARAGISLLNTEQFDTFRELFSRKRLRRRDQNARKARELQIDDDPRTVM